MMQRFILGLLCLLMLATGCQDGSSETGETAVSSPAVAQEATQPAATAPPTLIPTNTPIPPTSTPSVPLAARVNGQPITLEAFEEELDRYEQAQAQLGQPVPSGDSSHRQLVLNALIERELLIYEATVNRGYSVTPEELNGRLLSLQEAAGGADNFQTWLNTNLWTEESFLEALQGEMLIARVRDELDEQVPRTAEQIRARYLQVDDLALAQSIAAELAAGANFGFLAQQHSLDRITGENGGDLGYFARNALLVPELEEAAFALAEPGSVSNIISVVDAETNRTTHYIIQLEDRNDERPLPTEMRLTMLQQQYDALLASLQETAEIVILLSN